MTTIYTTRIYTTRPHPLDPANRGGVRLATHLGRTFNATFVGDPHRQDAMRELTVAVFRHATLDLRDNLRRAS